MKNKLNVKKRLLSLLLTAVMVMGMIPVTAPHVHAVDEGDVEWTDEWGYAQITCDDCGAGYVEGPVEDIDEAWNVLQQYICQGCGRCSEAGNADCFLEHHCAKCGDCIDDDYCDGCYNEYDIRICFNCIESEENELHCQFCGEHYGEGVAPCDCEWFLVDHHCQDCGDEECDECGIHLVIAGNTYPPGEGDGCVEHNLCNVCIHDVAGEDGVHCKECFRCDEAICDDCGMCSSCTSWEEHCPVCDTCFGDDGVQWCESGGEHCIECCTENDWICEQCGECTNGQDIEQCDDCGLCVDCCSDNSSDAECTHGYCVESSDYDDHLCPGCMTCPDDTECEYCGFCEDCQDDYHCEHGICPECDEWEEHLCEGCGNCYDLDQLCELCHMAECCWEHCEHELCPEDFDYDDHFCEQCGDCFDASEFCDECGLCLTCCAENTDAMDCEHDFCVQSDDFRAHWCYTDEQCLEKCSHNACAHEHVASEWSKNDLAHWHVCEDCGVSVDEAGHTKGAPVTIKEPNPLTRTNGTALVSCTVCGQSLGTVSIPYVDIPADGSPYIITQPKDYTGKTNITAWDDTAEAPYATYEVKAGGEGTLTYQWYKKYKNGTVILLSDEDDLYYGAKTPTLKALVGNDTCDEVYVWYYCVVTNAKGSATTREAAENAHHVYGRYADNRDGTHSYKCLGECDHVKSTKPHRYGDWVVTSPATATQEGLKEQTCVDCGSKNTMPIPKVEPGHAHRFDQAKYNISQHWFECACGLKDNTTAEDHDFDTTDVIRAATETSMGENRLTCSTCGYSKTEKTDKLPHTHDFEVFGSDSDYHYLRCDICKSAVISEPHDDFSWYLRTEATPSNSGLLYRYCGVCGRYEKKPFPYGSYSVMVQGGTPDKFFAQPGETVTVTYTPLYPGAPFKWVEGESYWRDLSTDPTFSELKSVSLSPNATTSTVTFVMPDGHVGLMSYPTRCDHSGGTRQGARLEPTCTGYGHEPDTLCADCGVVLVEGERIPALGHDYSGGPVPGTERVEYCTNYLGTINAPNTEKGGYSGDFVCRRCNETVKGEKTPLQHGLHDHAEIYTPEPGKVWTDFQEWRGIVDPSCTRDGYTGDLYCKYCSKLIERGDKDPRHGHKWGDWETVKPATTTQKGVEKHVCEYDDTHVETRITDYLGPDYRLKPDKTKVHFDFTYGDTVEPIIVTYSSIGRNAISRVESVEMDMLGNGAAFTAKVLDDFRVEISITDQAIVVVNMDTDGVTRDAMYVDKVPETNSYGVDLSPYVNITANVRKTAAKYTLTVEGGYIEQGGIKIGDVAQLHGGEEIRLIADDAGNFARWEIVEDNSGLIAALLDDIGLWQDDYFYCAMSPNDVTVRALYKDDVYTVSFDKGEGSGSMANAYVKKGEKLTLPECGFTPPSTDKEFDKWEVAGTKYNVGDTITISGDTTVKAIWKDSTTPQPTTYTVTFNMNGHGDQIADQTVTEGGNATKPADPTASGWTFDGWYADATFSVAFDFNTAINADTTIYAKWTENTPGTYTVTFDANGGSVTPTSAVTGTDGKLASLPTPTRSGSYHFNGWYTAASGGTKVTLDKVYTADTTIYAHWTYTGGGGGGVTYYTLTFNTNGGSAISSVSGTYGKVIDLDKYVPTKSGYDFGGWYSDSALTSPVDEIKLTGNKTVYAKWNKENPNTGAELPFTDVKATDWSYEDIAYVYEKGLMQGTSATTFAPQLSTSRAMIVTILWRLEGAPVVNYAMSFTDVAPDQWYTEAIRWAQANGIVKGYSAEKFGTNDPITREQMAAILYRYAGFKGYDVSAKADLSKFADSDKIGGWAVDAIAWANANNLVNGVSATELAPQGKATREQVAAILHRFCENIVK